MRQIACLFFVALALMGCGTPFQGIKMRVQSPPLDEAFRKVSLAFTTDGYDIASMNPSQYQLETKWREAKERELSSVEQALGAQRIEVKLSLRMQARGKLFDVFCTPLLRTTLHDGTVQETVAGATHPLREKWEEVFRRLLEREAKEED